MITLANIHSERLDDTLRVAFTAKLFGGHFPTKLEPKIYGMADMLAPAYNGGYWHFYGLSNGGFYMAPATDTVFVVSCENGFDGKLSADALGITACLYAYSNLSFGEGAFPQTCAQHYQLLREFSMEHAEARAILRATD
ncbi:MAG TPA: antirestriction protein [Rhodoferax sp.]|nr:antirestriction protein [Rhodoferax sp.]